MRAARRSLSFGAAGLAIARASAHRGLISGIALTIAVSVALLCGLAAWTAWQTRETLQTALTGAEGSAVWTQVQTRPADDLEAQDAAARAVIEDVFGDSVTVEGVAVGDPGDDGYRVAWRITPDENAVDATWVERLDEGAARLPNAFRASDAAVRGAVFTGELDVVLGALVVGARAARAIAPVPLALIGILAWFAVFELGRLLGSSRGREVALLRARGLSARQDAGLAAAESSVLAIGAGVGGFAVALGALLLSTGSTALAPLAETWPIGLGAVIVFGVTLAVAGSRAATAAASPRASAGRVSAAASGAAAVLVVLAALVLVWQLRATADAPTTQPWRIVLISLAPTFAVAAVAVVTVLLIPPVSSLVARQATRARGPALPSRQVARRAVGFSVAVALSAIMAAGATLAASYVGTWQSGSATAAAVAAGAQLSADVPSDHMSPELVADAAALDEVSAVAPVVTSPVEFGDTTGSLVAVPGSAIEALVIPVPGVIDPPALAETLTVADTGAVALDTASTGIRVTARATAHSGFGVDVAPAPDEAGRVYFRAWLVDARQVPALIELRMTATVDAVGTTLVGEGDLPAGSAPWSLIGIDASIRAASPFTQAIITDVVVDQLAGEASSAVDVAPVNVAVGGDTSVPQALLWTAATRAPDRVPGVITAELARTLTVGVGDSLDARFAGSGRVTPVTVAAIVEAVPARSTRER